MVSTVWCVLYFWCDAGIGGGGRGPGSVSLAWGLPGASIVAVCALLSCFFTWYQGAVSRILFGCTECCLVLCVALFPPPRCALIASCRCRLLWALVVCFRSAVLLVRARGTPLRLGVCLWGFPAVAYAVTPLPTIAPL